MYQGFCHTCNVSHGLSADQAAIHAAHELNMRLDEHGRLDFDSSDPRHANPLFNTDYLWTKGPGRMMGVLIAADSASEPRKTVALKAFSGQISECWHIPG